MAEKLTEELTKVKIEPELTDKEYMNKHHPESVRYLKKVKNKYGFDGRLNETSPCVQMTNLTHHDRSKSQMSETNLFKSPHHETSTSHITPISSSVPTAPPAQRITFPHLDNTNTEAYLLIKVPSGNGGTQFVIQKARGNKQWKEKKGEGGSQKNRDRREGRCFKCHRKGHLARDCEAGEEQRSRKKRQDDEEEDM